MNKAISMRDTFWSRIYNIAKEDRNVYIVCADMGAPALDIFKESLKEQFINVGIAEQNAVLIATGLALQGKKVYVYAIAPFVTMRCYEQIRIYAAGMDLPITIVGVGAGVCYEESGPTHHAVEDITLLRCLPNMEIYSASDNSMTRAFADISYQSSHPNYVRLDRIVLPEIYPPNTSFDEGIAELSPVKPITLLSTGCTVSNIIKAKEILNEKGIEVGVLDVYKLPINKQRFKELIKDVKYLLTVEEHTLPGGLGSYIAELILDEDLNCKLKRLGFDFNNKYCYLYGGRNVIQKEYKFDVNGVIESVERILNENDRLASY